MSLKTRFFHSLKIQKTKKKVEPKKILLKLLQGPISLIVFSTKVINFQKINSRKENNTKKNRIILTKTCFQIVKKIPKNWKMESPKSEFHSIFQADILKYFLLYSYESKFLSILGLKFSKLFSIFSLRLQSTS